MLGFPYTLVLVLWYGNETVPWLSMWYGEWCWFACCTRPAIVNRVVVLVWVFSLGLLHGSPVFAGLIIMVFHGILNLAAWKGTVSCRLSLKGNLFKNP